MSEAYVGRPRGPGIVMEIAAAKAACVDADDDLAR